MSTEIPVAHTGPIPTRVAATDHVGAGVVTAPMNGERSAVNNALMLWATLLAFAGTFVLGYLTADWGVFL